ncbi:MAG: hypothetical protein ACREP2_11535 [Rhodanobacteraceae bacterium]
MNAQIAPNRESVFTRIGRLLDLKVESEADLFRIGQGGITSHAFRRATSKLDLPLDLIGPATTIRRRLEANQRFNTAESERLLRVARVYAEAAALFGDEAATKAWMNAATEFVPGQPPVTPVQLATSDSGARLIEATILRTAHGIF